MDIQKDIIFPSEIFAHIAEWLYEKDYVNLLLSSKAIYEASRYYRRYPYPMTEYQEESYLKLFRTDSINSRVYLTSLPFGRIEIVLVNYMIAYLKKNNQRKILISCKEYRKKRWKSLLSPVFEDSFTYNSSDEEVKEKRVLLIIKEHPIFFWKNYDPTLVIRDGGSDFPIFSETIAANQIFSGFSYRDPFLDHIHIHQGFQIPFPKYPQYYIVYPDLKEILLKIFCQQKKIIYVDGDRGLAKILMLRRICRGICRVYTNDEKDEFDPSDPEEKAILLYSKKDLKIPIKELSGVILTNIFLWRTIINYYPIIISSKIESIYYYHVPHKGEKEFYGKHICFLIIQSEIKMHLLFMNVTQDPFLSFLEDLPKSKNFKEILTPIKRLKELSIITTYTWQSRDYINYLYSFYMKNKEGNNHPESKIKYLL